ncbi:MAG: response regulator transcription factor [Actinomycetota bacterium]
MAVETSGTGAFGSGPHVNEDAIKVLVVDDEANITDLVATVLRYEGFDVRTAKTGREALRTVEKYKPHLIVLDVMLPDLDGFEVQNRLADQRVPIVFLTAKDATEDKVRGLTMGADDYVTKPFSLEELVARVRAVIRRAHGDAARHEPATLQFEDLEMNEDSHEVWRAKEPVELTPTEFTLLRYLMLNPKRVLSKSQILDHVWHYDFAGDANVVETYISYLRKKIDRFDPPLIHTVRGVGYCLRLPKT